MPALLKAMNLPEIRCANTWLQTGNLVFVTQEESTAALEQIISARIAEAFGLSVTVLVRSACEWKNIIRSIPWTADPSKTTEYAHVTFLQCEPDSALVSALDMKHEDGEFWLLEGREAYLYCPFGYSRTKLANSAFERMLGVPATTRNWNTVMAVDAMLNSLPDSSTDALPDSSTDALPNDLPHQEGDA